MSDRVPFVLAATAHGPMIVNRLDYSPVTGHPGVGLELLQKGEHEKDNIAALSSVLSVIRKLRGRQPVFLDGGANIGTIALDVARTGAKVTAVEPQWSVYYALCGNVALNNLFDNVHCLIGILADRAGFRDIPLWEAGLPENFGGFSLVHERALARKTVITASQRLLTIDNLFGTTPLDLIKLDVEGMEREALRGGKEVIRRDKPAVFAETLFVKGHEIQEELGTDYIEVVLNHTHSFFFHKDDHSAFSARA